MPEQYHGSIYATIFAGHLQYLVNSHEELQPDTEYVLGELYYHPIRHLDLLRRIAQQVQQKMPELKKWPAWNQAMEALKSASEV